MAPGQDQGRVGLRTHGHLDTAFALGRLQALKSSTTSGRCTAGSITCEGSPSSSSKRVRKVSWRAISALRARSKAGQSSSF